MDEFYNPDSRSPHEDGPAGSPMENQPADGLTQPKQPLQIEITEDSETASLQKNQNVDFSENRKTVISQGKTDGAHPKKQTSADVGLALQGTQLEHFQLTKFES